MVSPKSASMAVMRAPPARTAPRGRCADERLSAVIVTVDLLCGRWWWTRADSVAARGRFALGATPIRPDRGGGRLRDELGRRRGGQRRGELAPRTELELAVGTREVDLDGLHRDEQRLGDVAVAQPFGGERRDAPLARG